MFKTTNELLPNSLIGRKCWYQALHTDKTVCATIKEVNIKITENCNSVTCILNNGVVAVMHTPKCPDYIGNKVWGFLSKSECEDYWDM